MPLAENRRLREALGYVRDYPTGWEGTSLSIRDYINGVLDAGPSGPAVPSRTCGWIWGGHDCDLPTGHDGPHLCCDPDNPCSVSE